MFSWSSVAHTISVCLGMKGRRNNLKLPQDNEKLAQKYLKKKNSTKTKKQSWFYKMFPLCFIQIFISIFFFYFLLTNRWRCWFADRLLWNPLTAKSIVTYIVPDVKDEAPVCVCRSNTFLPSWAWCLQPQPKICQALSVWCSRKWKVLNVKPQRFKCTVWHREPQRLML